MRSTLKRCSTIALLFLAPLIGCVNGAPPAHESNQVQCPNITTKEWNEFVPIGPIRSCDEARRMIDVANAIDALKPELWRISALYYRAMSPEEFQQAILEFISSLDPHSAYMNPKEFQRFQESASGGFPSGVGLQIGGMNKVGVLVIGVMEGMPAERGGMKMGDLIIAIDGKKATTMKSIDEVVKALRGSGPGTVVQITYLRQGVPDPTTVSLTRSAIQTTVIKGTVEGGQFGRLRISQFSGVDDEDFARKVKIELDRIFAQQGIRALAIDLRGNPGGILGGAVNLSSLVVGERGARLLSVKDRQGVHPVRDRRGVDMGIGRVVDERLRGLPIAILVDKGSASASEIVAGNAKCYNSAFIVGPESTFGKGSVQSVYNGLVVAGSGVKFTTSEYIACGEVPIQGRGVAPDIVIKQGHARAGIREADLSGSITGSERTKTSLSGRETKDVKAHQLPVIMEMLRALNLEVLE